MRTRWATWTAGWILCIATLLAFGTPASARIGDGRLILRWSGTIPAQAQFRLTDPFGGTVEGFVADLPDRTYLAEGIPSGQAQLDLSGPDGLRLRWQFLVTSESTTQAVVHLDTGVLEIVPIHPDPFGNTQDWNAADLAALPGVGVDGALQASVPAAAGEGPRLPGDLDGPVSRIDAPSVGLDREAVGYQQPLGGAAAWSSSSAPLVYTARASGPRLSILAGAANGSTAWGRVRVRLRGEAGPLGLTTTEVALSGSAIGDAGPLGIAGEKLPRNGLDLLEARLGVFARPRAGLLRFTFHATGTQRDHFLQEFARDTRHAPRQDNSTLTAAAAWDRSLGRHGVTLEAGYHRGFNETGDGQAFDALRKYRIGASSTNDRVSDDGLYWWGGRATSSVPPHLYNYYTQDLTSTWSLRGETRLSLIPHAPLRAGVEASFTTWRWYEHLDPIIDAENTTPTGGFQYASYLGYTRDGSAHADAGLHAAPQPRQLALFASQRAPLGPAVLEAGARWTRFSSGQGALLDPADPVGPDGHLDAGDFRAETNTNRVEPRLGLFLPLGSRGAAWVDAVRQQENPPLEALYVSPNRLEHQASLARTGRLGAAHDQVFGNGALKPVTWDRFTAGFLGQPRGGVSLRLTGRVARARDTWVATRVDAGVDSLAYYDNRGKQRERGLRLGLDASMSRRSRLRLTWDVSRRETNVIEPLPLYRALLYPGLPVEGTGAAETASLAGPWFDHPEIDGWFPSIFDRTHRISAAWLVRLDRGATGSLFGPLLDRGDLAFVVRAASGRPYTPTYVQAEGLMGTSQAGALIPGLPLDPNGNGRLDASEVNSERMPWTVSVDLGVQRRFTFGGRDCALLLEVRNILGRNNARAVYGATGEADNDGWLGSSAGQAYLQQLGSGATAFRSAYLDRLDDPNRFEEGRTIRAALGFEL